MTIYDEALCREIHNLLAQCIYSESCLDGPYGSVRMWKCPNMEVSEYGSVRIWECPNMEVSQYESGTWDTVLRNAQDRRVSSHRNVP